MPLTHTIINKLTPSEKCTPSRPDKHSDGDGLQLWVRHTGNKVWVSAYRWQGRQQSLTLGKYPVITLQQARQRNLEIKQLINEGINPKDKKKEQRAEQDGSRLFDTIAQAWYADRKTFLASSTFSRNYSAYIRDVKPVIGHKLIDDITSPDILTIGKNVEQRGANEMARRIMAEVGQVFKHAIRTGMATSNPAADLSAAIKPHKTKNHSRITSKELPQLLSDIDNYTGHITVKLGLWFLCYTFVRTNELRFMEWSEIDWNDKTWRIPANKMKMDRPHVVPLAPQVMRILERIKELNFSEQYVFYNPSTRKPYSQNAFINALYQMGYKYKMTGHGFRGLASTTLHEQGFMHEAIELQLAHEQENKISKAYNGAQHLEYRRDMMNEWASFVDSACNNNTKT
ncbi:integrase [Psychrobacter sp. 4Dc]|jgi:integrase|uniref:tyrosine-type recombinase/integrase n=1 Tax=unclassified Psychrobacter TaxID=196806 RepID=UPI000CC541AC|nr:integrase arm-type DNA-binding domain-containing protein [Psychrobacter sp. 4Dc]PKH65755.1 integrase [Psychrobacter sp. 4Dc]